MTARAFAIGSLFLLTNLALPVGAQVVSHSTYRLVPRVVYENQPVTAYRWQEETIVEQHPVTTYRTETVTEKRT